MGVLGETYTRGPYDYKLHQGLRNTPLPPSSRIRLEKGNGRWVRSGEVTVECQDGPRVLVWELTEVVGVLTTYPERDFGS